MNIYMYEVTDSTTDDNLTYGVTNIVYPDTVINSNKTKILDQFFRNSVDGAVRSAHGKLLTETIIKING